MLSNSELKRRKKLKKPELSEDISQFKQQEKKYKHYNNFDTDFSEILSINSKEFQHQSIDDFEVYKLDKPDGVYLVKNFLQKQDQLQLTLNCINKYVNKPYRTNIVDDLSYTKDVNQYCFNEKIRWANLGYQYDWTSRKYPPQQLNIPEYINNLCEKVKLFWKNIDQQFDNYDPESTLINIYGCKDSMGGHIDDAELDQINPIFSLNVGLSAVFLIGGMSKEQKPHAIKLESGDLLVMSGQSRQAYHGVPRIIENSFKPFNLQLDDSIQTIINDNQQFENNHQHAIKFLQTHRINLNFRQVNTK